MEFNSLYQELAQSTEMIRVLLAGISQEEAQVIPSTDSWSILEVICHLYDEEREDFREHLDFILHRQHEEWRVIDPQGWVNERKYNEKNLTEMLDMFFEERRNSLKWLKTISSADMETGYTTEFGFIKAGDIIASWTAHDNLHIRQLVELRRVKIESITHPYSILYAGDW